jgi:hypothetical protein
MTQPRPKPKPKSPLQQKLDLITQWHSQGFKDMIVIALSQDSLKFDVPPNMELGEVVGALQSLIDDLRMMTRRMEMNHNPKSPLQSMPR